MRRPGGFTLIELLVVLALLGGMTAVAWPAVTRWLDGARARAAVADLRGLLLALPVRTFYAGQPEQFDGERLRALLAAGDDLRLELDAPLRYSALGVASGGRVVVRTAGGAPLALSVLPVTGEVVDAAP